MTGQATGDGRWATGDGRPVTSAGTGTCEKGGRRKPRLDSVIVEGLSGEERLFDPIS